VDHPHKEMRSDLGTRETNLYVTPWSLQPNDSKLVRGTLQALGSLADPVCIFSSLEIGLIILPD